MSARHTIKFRLVTCAKCGGTGKVGKWDGRTLRAARENAGMSLRELARRIGWSPTHLSDMELGRRNVTVKSVELYERYLS